MVLSISKYEWQNAIKGKSIIVFFLFYFVMTWAVISAAGTMDKANLIIYDLTLISLPLISLLMGIIYVYQSSDFIVLLLTQPIKRSHVFWGLFCGFTIPVIVAFSSALLLAYGVNVLINPATMLTLMSGILIIIIFSAIAFLIGFIIEDRTKGVGLIIIIWLFLAVLYDALILYLAFALSEYPIDKLILGLSIANPIDLFRTLYLINYEVSALLGYSGAVFKRFFGSELGPIIISLIVFCWISIALYFGHRVFKKRDF